MKEIKLNHGKIALVDDKDFEWLSKFNWYAEKTKNTFYAMRYFYNSEKRKKDHKRMHREILGLNDPKIVTDHIDRNGLNNQRSNLRACKQAENVRNSSLRKTSITGFKGVSLYTAKNVFKDYNGPTFRARIMLKRKEISLGYFKTAKEAALARDSKIKELHGEFATFNKI